MITPREYPSATGFICFRESEYRAMCRRFATWNYTGLHLGLPLIEGTVDIVATGDDDADYNIAYHASRADARQVHTGDILGAIQEWRIER